VRTVLVLEDDAESILLYELGLSNSETEVISFQMAHDAMEYLATPAQVHGVIMDLSVPGLDPARLVSLVRKKQSHEVIPVIVVSGRAELHTIAMAIKADAALIKPIELDRLVEALESSQYEPKAKLEKPSPQLQSSLKSLL
jgi:CheY-like chemotaxis protein